LFLPAGVQKKLQQNTVYTGSPKAYLILHPARSAFWA